MGSDTITMSTIKRMQGTRWWTM